MSYTGELRSDQILSGPRTGVGLGAATVASGLGLSGGKLNGYDTAIDIDFTNIGNSTLSSAGPYTIGGIPYCYVGGSARSSPQITAGTGLVFAPSINTDWYTNKFTLSRLALPVSSMLPGVFDLNCRFRVWVACSISNCANYGNLAFGLAASPIGTLASDNWTDAWSSRIVRGYNNGNHLIGAAVQKAGTEAASASVSAPNTTYSDLLVMDVDSIPPKRILFRRSSSPYTYNANSPWPDLSTLAFVNEVYSTPNRSTPDVALETSPNIQGIWSRNWYLVLGGFWYDANATATDFKMTFKRVRIDVRP